LFSKDTGTTGKPESFVMPDGQRYHIYKGQLFTISTGKFYKKGGFTPKQKRAYMPLRSGMTLAVAKKQRICFMTLSTQYDKAEPEKRLDRQSTLTMPLQS